VEKILRERCGITFVLGLEFPADPTIERIKAAAVGQEIERRDEPHQRIFHAELVPEIAADPPALEIGHDQEQDKRHAG
jgi:hypothetical protein